jgi:hypothetical protein
LPSAQRGGPYHCRQAQRRQAQGRLGAGHGLPPVPFDGLIGRVGRRSGVPAAIAEMDAVGARMFAEQVAREHHERAMQALRQRRIRRCEPSVVRVGKSFGTSSMTRWIEGC